MIPTLSPSSILAIPSMSLTIVSGLSQSLLTAGDHLIGRSPVSSAYDFTHSGAGDYSVEPSNLFTYVDGGGTPKVLHATVEGIAKVRLSGGLGVSQHIHDNRGAFIGCKDTDRQRIEAAVVVLRESLEDARDYMNGIEGPTLRYETWFGTYDAVNKNVVQGILGTVSAERLHKDMRYRCLAKCSNPYTLAYAGTYIPQRRDRYLVANRSLDQGRTMPGICSSVLPSIKPAAWSGSSS